jgi:hypothetical protein
MLNVLNVFFPIKFSMAFCYVENLNSSKPSEGRVFVAVFYNQHGSPIHVECLKRPLQVLHRHPLVKFWEASQGEPMRVRIVGSIYETWVVKAVRGLKSELVKYGAHFVDEEWFKVRDGFTDEVLKSGVSEVKQRAALNRWVAKMKVKTFTPVVMIKQRVTVEQLEGYVDRVKDGLTTGELNFVRKLVDSFDIRTQKFHIVYSPQVLGVRMSPEQVKKMLMKTGWFVKQTHPFRAQYSNEYVLTKHALRQISLLKK